MSTRRTILTDDACGLHLYEEVLTQDIFLEVNTPQGQCTMFLCSSAEWRQHDATVAHPVIPEED
jgi:hypothetical protein